MSSKLQNKHKSEVLFYEKESTTGLYHKNFELDQKEFKNDKDKLKSN